jgi:hypothetical protein
MNQILPDQRCTVPEIKSPIDHDAIALMSTSHSTSKLSEADSIDATWIWAVQIENETIIFISTRV